MYVAFSAASNVTGILTDTVAVSELCHKYGALSFWDYASAGPYLKIDMNPTPDGLEIVFLFSISLYQIDAILWQRLKLIDRTYDMPTKVSTNLSLRKLVLSNRLQLFSLTKSYFSCSTNPLPAILKMKDIWFLSLHLSSIRDDFMQQPKRECQSTAAQVVSHNIKMTCMSDESQVRPPFFSESHAPSAACTTLVLLKNSHVFKKLKNARTRRVIVFDILFV